LKTPTWGEIEEFCRKDGWNLVRETKHTFFQKALPDGTVLQTHRSFAKDKTIGADRFKAILSVQLRVTDETFWEVIRTGKPAARPAPVAKEAPVAHPAYVVRVLTQDLGKSEEEIGQLSADEARRLVQDFWSRQHV
jgi:hypothetical protein